MGFWGEIVIQSLTVTVGNAGATRQNTTEDKDPY